MSKPEDIPQDIWGSAYEVFVDAVRDQRNGEAIIARAILAERKRCRTAIQKAYDVANSGPHPFSARECRTSYAISTAMAEIDR